MNLLKIVPDFVKSAFGIVDKFVTDKDKAIELKAELAMQANDLQSQVLSAQESIIVAEAKNSSWLTSNWRPLTMVTFTGLIVARWFGFAAPNLSESEYLALWGIVKIGLGGYVIGRSTEKVLPGLIGALKK